MHENAHVFWRGLKQCEHQHNAILEICKGKIHDFNPRLAIQALKIIFNEIVKFENISKGIIKAINVN